MKTVIFCNEEAGSFEACQANMGSIPEVLEQITGNKTVFADVHEVTDADLATAERAIVMGGDGTVSRVLARLANHSPRIPVGIIPAGTGNLLADCLGLKTDRKEDLLPFALETIRQGRIVSIDLGVANGTPFALDVAVGPLAMAVTKPEKQEKSAHGLLSYVRPLLKSMFERPYRFQIVADSVSFQCDASAVFVTNPQEMGIGQKADVSTLQDGKLNLFILDPKNLDDYVGMAIRFGSWFLGNAETDDIPYQIFEVRSASIEAIEELSKPPLLSAISPAAASDSGRPLGEDQQPTTMLDGDVFGHTPLTVSVLPLAIDVFVPASIAA